MEPKDKVVVVNHKQIVNMFLYKSGTQHIQHTKQKYIMYLWTLLHTEIVWSWRKFERKPNYIRGRCAYTNYFRKRWIQYGGQNNSYPSLKSAGYGQNFYTVNARKRAQKAQTNDGRQCKGRNGSRKAFAVSYRLCYFLLCHT